MDYRHLGQSGLKISQIAYESRIDQALGGVVVRDPSLTASPSVRP